jgi:hypothetical protein
MAPTYQGQHCPCVDVSLLDGRCCGYGFKNRGCGKNSTGGEIRTHRCFQGIGVRTGCDDSSGGGLHENKSAIPGFIAGKKGIGQLHECRVNTEVADKSPRALMYCVGNRTRYGRIFPAELCGKHRVVGNTHSPRQQRLLTFRWSANRYFGWNRYLDTPKKSHHNHQNHQCKYNSDATFFRNGYEATTSPFSCNRQKRRGPLHRILVSGR